MPFRVRNQRCTKQDGTRGEAVIEKQTSDGTWEKFACHDDEETARAVKARLDENEGLE